MGKKPRRLTRDDLKWFKSEIDWGEDIGFLAYQLGGAITRHFLGDDWLGRHFISDDPPTDFFRNPRMTDDDAIVGSRRLIDLGEMRFNLQHVEGFDHCIS